ncbi:Smr/MutS family protein [Pseudochrobactrum kiredjianiae]|uniref:Smr/MutS family protein n=1 Tax=Pseudochrobactrum kiredjianiae TaxID=386305 RepID=A0ABW3V5A1_9HYPH|nr:Smr/MutS family protein [Pseudochrobactrum kiredjianiae]MDM7849567.1 Smr/MutS family protein [Pseudochrobactrum kiredjianiae]
MKTTKKKRSAPRVSDKDMMRMLKNPKEEQKPAEISSHQISGFLKAEDRILWETIARTTRPLRPVAKRPAFVIEDMHLWDMENGLNIPQRVQDEPVKAAVAKASRETSLQTQKKQETLTNPLHDIDRPTIRKIAKGRVDIQARIDLHGMRQHEAHDLLYGFLSDAWHRGLRFVLVITGKGTSMGSDGVLKQAVPHWFSTPLFRIYVSAYEDAVRHHGGQGALYVRLRKTPAEKLAERQSLPLSKRSLS